jgi:hypothetical protein
VKRKYVALLFVVGVALLVAWVARNTYWDEVDFPTPPKGEAARNPFYATQRFAVQLGAHAAWDRVLSIPSPESVIVLSSWNWNVNQKRRAALERWVESGGRLVIDWALMGDPSDFEEWSGIARDYPEEKENVDADTDHDTDAAQQHVPRPCHKLNEKKGDSTSARQYWLCDFDENSFLTSERTVDWSLSNEDGAQAMRVSVGRGSVTVVNAASFRGRGIFDGDHGWLFIAATQLRRGEDVHFLSEEEQPSLLALLWIYGSPVVVLAFVLVGLALWRGGVRFGPLAAPPPSGRRSLAEQIRGTGQFVIRHNGGEALHSAAVRALDEAARRRVSGYAGLSARERAEALADLTGFDRNALAAAIYHPGLRGPHELRSTIGLLEAARRLVQQPRPAR